MSKARAKKLLEGTTRLQGARLLGGMLRAVPEPFNIRIADVDALIGCSFILRSRQT